MDLRTIIRRFTPEQLQEAIRMSRAQGKRDKLEAVRRDLQKRLDRVERKLAALDNASGNGASTEAKPGRKTERKRGYKLSKSTRNKMRLAALARYRKAKPEAAKPERKTRTLSAAGRAAISAAAKKRWEAARLAKAEPKTAAE